MCHSPKLKTKTIKFLVENKKFFFYLGVGKGFLDVTQKAAMMKENCDEFDLIKNKTSAR